MAHRFPPIAPQCPHLLHGADYNPDQWPPEVWAEDLRLMTLCGANIMSVGIFAWARLEPREGEYDFEWLDRVLDGLAAQGAVACLATPSGARPAWLSQYYPEVLRVGPNRVRNLHGSRHNHCYTSPLYRQKVQAINRALATRYAKHPALAIWHLSNEYGGECHCEKCQAAFREWLQVRYGSLGALNAAWWTSFWAHTYTDWAQIESPAPHGETSVHGLNLDWKRFVTDQTLDFMRTEMAPLREITPDKLITTNFMGTYPGLNYWALAGDLDVVSWDSYPQWHGPGSDVDRGCSVSMVHDIYRALKHGRPWMLMESTPSVTNWQEVGKLKRPGVHLLSSLQAVAHGADTVQYFQWRKSRGSSEKLHGAVVDHVGTEETRVFGDVAQVGAALSQLDRVVGSSYQPEVALIYDWENEWALRDAQGPRREKGYGGAVLDAYRPFWAAGIGVDVIDSMRDFGRYKLLIAPMLYMLRPGVAQRLRDFVAAGGTLITGYQSGIVNETDLCFLGGWPGDGLRALLGVWNEEVDALYDGETQQVRARGKYGLEGTYEARELCALIHAEGAEVVATYASDFYAGQPAVTRNAYGQGTAWYVAPRLDRRFHSDLAAHLATELNLDRALPTPLPDGVTAQIREADGERYIFLLNFAPDPRQVTLGPGYRELLMGVPAGEVLTLEGYGVAVVMGQGG